jgi:Viral BACON domain
MWPGLRRIPLSYNRRSIAVALAVFAAGCGESAVTHITGPGPATRCETALTGLPTTVPSSASRLTATVSTNRECRWTIESDASWMQVSPSSGQGEASVSVVVAENPVASDRSGALVVNGSRVAVSQVAAPCRFELSSSSSRVSPEGGAFKVSVSAVSECRWSASSEVPWVRVASSGATGTGSAEFIVEANTGGERSGTLRIAGLPFLVQQTATGPPVPPPSPPPVPPPTPPPAPSPLTLVSEPSTMPVGYLGQRFAGLRVRARGGRGPYRITGTNLLGWPSSLDYKVDPEVGTADWHGTVTRAGEFPVRMAVEDATGARGELMLTFVFRAAPTPLREF